MIGVLSRKVKARRARRRIPKCVWDFHIIWEAQIYSRTVHNNHTTPLEAIAGDTVDISEWTEFKFYDLVVYWDDRENEAGQSIGTWLGPSHHIGSALCYYILTEKATVLSRTSVQHITVEEFETIEMKERITAYHEALNKNMTTESVTLYMPTWRCRSGTTKKKAITLAEYAVANGIAHEPAFNWWVHKVIKRKERQIKKVKSKYWRTTHKFGIEVPKSVEHAYEIDRVTGTSHWTKAIEKEMRNVRIAFEKIDDVTEAEMRTGKIRPGYSYCSTHMVFDIKMDGSFTRKARLVADGHKTRSPTSITYSSVVSWDSVRIALTIASLNSLHVSACDIGNAYVNATCREKLWTVAGPEFGSDKGSVMTIARALYGLKSSGAAWRSTLAQTMEILGYRPTRWIQMCG